MTHADVVSSILGSCDWLTLHPLSQFLEQRVPLNLPLGAAFTQKVPLRQMHLMLTLEPDQSVILSKVQEERE